MIRAARWLAVIGVVACAPTADRPAPSTESAGADSGALLTVRGEWPPELGSALLVPLDADSIAVLLHPVGAAALRPLTTATLIAPSGATAVAGAAVSRIAAVRCGDAPVDRIVGAPQSWAVGVQAPTARALLIDSVDVGDSAAATYQTDMARLASAVGAGAPSRLTGLRYELMRLRRVRFAGREVVAAVLIRRLSLEASPAEERTLVVAERAGTAAFRTVHAAQSEGSEETTSDFDLLAAFQGASGALLLMATDAPTSATYEVLRESAGGTWSVAWSRTLLC